MQPQRDSVAKCRSTTANRNNLQTGGVQRSPYEFATHEIDSDVVETFVQVLRVVLEEKKNLH